jgi:hypothetical protein
MKNEKEVRRAFTTNQILIGSFPLAGDERSNGGRSSHWRRALLIPVITVTLVSTTPNNTSHHLRIGESEGILESAPRHSDRILDPKRRGVLSRSTISTPAWAWKRPASGSPLLGTFSSSRIGSSARCEQRGSITTKRGQGAHLDFDLISIRRNPPRCCLDCAHRPLPTCSQDCSPCS